VHIYSDLIYVLFWVKFVKSTKMAKGFYHNNVREALEKDGWLMTHDSYAVKVEEVGYELELK
jgi:XisH protein